MRNQSPICANALWYGRTGAINLISVPMPFGMEERVQSLSFLSVPTPFGMEERVQSISYLCQRPLVWKKGCNQSPILGNDLWY